MSLGGLFGGGGIGGIIGGMFGGPLGAMLGKMFEKIIGQVMTQVMDEMGKELGISDSTKNAAKQGFSDNMGQDYSDDNNVNDTLGNFQKQSNASDSDMGHIEREIKSLKDELKKLFNEMSTDNAESTDSKKKKAAAKGGEQGSNTNGTEGTSSTGGTSESGKSESSSSSDGIEAGDDWFIAVAKLLGKAAQKQAEVVKDKASKLSQATDAAAAIDPKDDKDGTKGKKADAEQVKAQVEATAQSQKMGNLMEGVMTAIKALGQALQTAARSQ